MVPGKARNAVYAGKLRYFESWACKIFSIAILEMDSEQGTSPSRKKKQTWISENLELCQ